jgi:hypothetical protein
MKRDDSLWKGILEDVFDDFLRFFYHNADEIFDFRRKPVFLDKELETIFPTNQDDFYPKYVDKLVKVYMQSGAENWFLIHIEVQGSADKKFSERMFDYFYRIYDKYKKPITAIAILTDNKPTFKPKTFELNFLGTRLLYEFNSYKILEQNEKLLNESNNAFAIVVQTVQVALKKQKLEENKLLELKVDLAKKLLSKQFSKSKIRALMNFLRHYVRFENKELITKFEGEIDNITNKSENTMGGIEALLKEREKRIFLSEMREKVKAEVKEEVKAEVKAEVKEELFLEKEYNFVKSLLLNTDFTVERIALLASVKTDFVLKVQSEI